MHAGKNMDIMTSQKKPTAERGSLGGACTAGADTHRRPAPGWLERTAGRDVHARGGEARLFASFYSI